MEIAEAGRNESSRGRMRVLAPGLRKMLKEKAIGGNRISGEGKKIKLEKKGGTDEEERLKENREEA